MEIGPGKKDFRFAAMIVVGYILLAIASIADGMVEGYEFDNRKSFERKFAVTPRSFWGSLSWMNKDSLYARLFGVFDFYHVADDLRKWGYMAGAGLIGYYLSAEWNGWHSVALLIHAPLMTIIAKQMSMRWIRN